MTKPWEHFTWELLFNSESPNVSEFSVPKSKETEKLKAITQE